MNKLRLVVTEESFDHVPGTGDGDIFADLDQAKQAVNRSLRYLRRVWNTNPHSFQVVDDTTSIVVWHRYVENATARADI